MTKFWGKLFLINFAMGVATGLVQEFQFGMNWSEYARFVGDIFGAPLAIEALLAFFLESTFLGLWIFGWDKLPKGVHAATIWLVAIGSNLSALWILIANSFMQQPMGYVLRNGRAEMESFAALVTNPHVFVQFPHVIAGAMATAAFFVLGISAWHLLRAEDDETRDAFRRSFRFGAVYALVATVAVIVVGHTQAQYMIRVQPMKMAAAEALWQTENPAAMSLFTWGNEPERRDVWAVRVPGLLSFLAYNRFEGEVRGIREIQAEYEAKHGPGDYVPPVKWTYWNFRAMAGAGMAMLLLAGCDYDREDVVEELRGALLGMTALEVPWRGTTVVEGRAVVPIGRRPVNVWSWKQEARVEEIGLASAVPDPERTFTRADFLFAYWLARAAGALAPP
jgi:cytochrome d ubiquinol oxidase subunit I